MNSEKKEAIDDKFEAEGKLQFQCGPLEIVQTMVTYPSTECVAVDLSKLVVLCCGCHRANDWVLPHTKAYI